MANGTLSLAFSGEMNQGERARVQRPLVSAAGVSSEGPNPVSLSPSSYPSASSSEGDAYYIQGVDDWRDGFYEPMGYHTGSSGAMLHAGVFGDPRLRRHIWNYCPEIRMTLAMDVAKYAPGDCNANWRRRNNGDINNDAGAIGIDDLGYGNEVIEGVLYPMLPLNLVPW